MRVIGKKPSKDTSKDPVLKALKGIAGTLVKLLDAKPADVKVAAPNVIVPTPNVTVKPPDIVFPGPPKKWKFEGSKSNGKWTIIAERIG